MDNMEFWGIEVKGKEASKVKVEEDHLLHLSQATLGELKKDGEPVTLYVKVDNKKLVLGVLNPKSNPQLSFDLVFEKDFEISHNWKNGSVHLLGYQSELPEDEEYPDFSDEDEEEDIAVPQKENGAVAVKVAAPKGITAKPKNVNKPKPGAKAVDEDDSDDEEDSDGDESDEDLVDMSDDSDDDVMGSEDDDEESSEEEETPAKVTESGKKRKPELKTPEPKKAKLAATPQKTDGKKGGHTATPHPAKKGGKTPPGGDKSAPKSGAQVSCGSCKKTFNSEVGLQSHTKAKHSGGK